MTQYGNDLEVNREKFYDLMATNAMLIDDDVYGLQWTGPTAITRLLSKRKQGTRIQFLVKKE